MISLTLKKGHHSLGNNEFNSKKARGTKNEKEMALEGSYNYNRKIGAKRLIQSHSFA